MAAIETLLFDFGGTLDADGVAWKDRFYSLCRAEGLDMTADKFARAYYAADDPLVGALPIAAGLPETVEALASNLEAELGWGGSERGRRVALRFLSDTSDIIDRNRPVLEALRERYRLGVVSNFYGNLEAVCQSSGLASLFAVMTDSCRVGAEKPDPAIFRAALDELRAAPETTLFVGDSLPRDCEGARRTGMGFIWIAPTKAQAAAAGTNAARSVLASIAALPDLISVLK